jgi:ribosomal protein S27AE
MKTAERDQIVREQKGEGIINLAYSLCMRPSEIMAIAKELHVTIPGSFLYGLDDEMLLHMSRDKRICPICGYGVIVPWKTSGHRYGVCEPCRNKALASVQDERSRNDAALREYSLARKKLQRARRRAVRECA